MILLEHKRKLTNIEVLTTQDREVLGQINKELDKHYALREAAPAMLEQLKIVESTLHAEFATPDTREGRIATALMNHVRKVIAAAEGRL